MDKNEYKKLVDSLTPKENKSKNMIIAFIIGGLVGLFTEILINILILLLSISRVEASMWACLIVIFISSLSTALGFFDSWVTKAKAGLILPTTGFAHSITSAAMDYRKDGFITGIGANVFKLAGSVILYGVISAFIFGLMGVFING